MSMLIVDSSALDGKVWVHVDILTCCNECKYLKNDFEISDNSTVLVLDIITYIYVVYFVLLDSKKKYELIHIVTVILE